MMDLTVRDEEGRVVEACCDLSLIVQILELGFRKTWHDSHGHLPQPLLAGVALDGFGVGQSKHWQNSPFGRRGTWQGNPAGGAIRPSSRPRALTSLRARQSDFPPPTRPSHSWFLLMRSRGVALRGNWATRGGGDREEAARDR